jgi:hypothetical protein
MGKNQPEGGNIKHVESCGGVKKKEALMDYSVVTGQDFQDKMQYSLALVMRGENVAANAVAIGDYLIGSDHYIFNTNGDPVKVGDKVKVQWCKNGDWKNVTVKVLKLVETYDVDSQSENFVFMTKPQEMKSIGATSNIQGSLATLAWWDKNKKFCTSVGTFSGSGYKASTERGACGAPVLIQVNNKLQAVGIHNAGGDNENYMLRFSSDFISQHFH